MILSIGFYSTIKIKIIIIIITHIVSFHRGYRCLVVVHIESLLSPEFLRQGGEGKVDVFRLSERLVGHGHRLTGAAVGGWGAGRYFVLAVDQQAPVITVVRCRGRQETVKCL